MFCSRMHALLTRSLLATVTKTMQLLPPGDSPYVSVKDTPCLGCVDTCVVIIFLDNCLRQHGLPRGAKCVGASRRRLTINGTPFRVLADGLHW